MTENNCTQSNREVFDFHGVWFSYTLIFIIITSFPEMKLYSRNEVYTLPLIPQNFQKPLFSICSDYQVRDPINPFEISTLQPKNLNKYMFLKVLLNKLLLSISTSHGRNTRYCYMKCYPTLFNLQKSKTFGLKQWLILIH